MTVGYLKHLLSHYDDDYEVRVWRHGDGPCTDAPEGTFIEHNFEGEAENVVVIY